MHTLDVVTVSALSESDRKRIIEIDPRIRLTDASDWAERDVAISNAEIVLFGNPFPKDLGRRFPNAKWLHQRVAGASNLWRGDFWGSNVIVTTARGDVGSYPIGEYAIAGLLYAARDFAQAERDKRAASFSRDRYQQMSLAGRTLCILGVGGIGRVVGRLAAGLGMSVIGVRHTVRSDEPLPEGFARIVATASLPDVLAESDAVVVSCQLTKETQNIMNAAAFAALRPGSIVVNVARGEIVDEAALLAALDSGHLKAAVLDVYAGENEGPPPARLWGHPKVLITPHNSPRIAGTPAGPGLGISIFCENLKAYLDGKEMKNVVDWTRGY